jgi:hypothetical protein
MLQKIEENVRSFSLMRLGSTLTSKEPATLEAKKGCNLLKKFLSKFKTPLWLQASRIRVTCVTRSLTNLTHCLRAKKGVKGDYRRHNKSKPPQEQIKGLLGT